MTTSVQKENRKVMMKVMVMMISGVMKGVWGGSTPHKPHCPEILKTLQNRAKLNPVVKTVKKC